MRYGRKTLKIAAPRRKWQRKINMLSDDFNRKLREKAYFFVTETNEAALTIGVITRDAEKLRDQLGDYLRALGVELEGHQARGDHLPQYEADAELCKPQGLY